MRFYGKTIKDLKKGLGFKVTDEQSQEGLRKNGEFCPGALGAKASCRMGSAKCTKAEVHRAVIYLDFGGKFAYRGLPSSALRREIISQDKGGKFDPGSYVIVPVPTRERTSRGKAHSKREPNHARPYKTKRAKPRLIQGIRKLALTSKNVSL